MATYFERLKKYYEETPIEILEREWEDILKQDNPGPEVNEYMDEVKKMSNIFKDAYFGKPYKTCSDKNAVYVGSDDYGHLLVIEGMDSISHYDNYGRLTYPHDPTFDIIDDDKKSESTSNMNFVNESIWRWLL